jgi:hypothetical protein
MQLRCLQREGASAHSSKSPPRAAQACESQTTPQSRRVHASCMHVRIKNSKGGGSVHSRCLQREGASAHSSKSPPRAAQACESQTTPQSRRVHASCMHVRIKNSKGGGSVHSRCLQREGASAHSSKSPPRAAQACESQTTPQSRRVHASCMHVRIKNSKGGGSVHSRCLQREGASAHSSKSPPRAAQACESQTTPQSRRVHASCMHVRIKNSKGLGACIFRCFF